MLIDNKNMKDIALVIGGGGAKGLCGIGVIDRLLELGADPDYIVGTSIGAMIGACVAYEYDTDYIKKIFKQNLGKKFLKLLDINIINKSLIKGEKIEETFNVFFMGAKIEELPKKFECVSTKLIDGSRYVFSKGDLTKAVRASISLPGVFEPVKEGDNYLIDGGVSSPVPILRAVEKGYKKIIVINFLNHSKESNDPDLIKTLSASAIHIQNNIFKEQLKEAKRKADIFLIEPDTSDKNILDFFSIDSSFEYGRNLMDKKMNEIKSFLNH